MSKIGFENCICNKSAAKQLYSIATSFCSGLAPKSLGWCIEAEIPILSFSSKLSGQCGHSQYVNKSRHESINVHSICPDNQVRFMCHPSPPLSSPLKKTFGTQVGIHHRKLSQKFHIQKIYVSSHEGVRMTKNELYLPKLHFPTNHCVLDPNFAEDMMFSWIFAQEDQGSITTVLSLAGPLSIFTGHNISEFLSPELAVNC